MSLHEQFSISFKAFKFKVESTASMKFITEPVYFYFNLTTHKVKNDTKAYKKNYCELKCDVTL